MAFHLAYTIGFGSSITSINHSFQTEAARSQFITGKMPTEAKRIRIWPQPSFVSPKKSLWWELNKRPFADKYELIGENV